MASENWEQSLSELDTNKSFNVFQQKLLNSIEKHAPEKTLKVGKKVMVRDPWITNSILRSIN